MILSADELDDVTGGFAPVGLEELDKRASASRQHDRGVAALPGFVLAAMGTLVCVGAVVIGLLAMVHKPS